MKVFNKVDFKNMLYSIEDNADLKAVLSLIECYFKDYHNYYDEKETKEILDAFKVFKKKCIKNL